MELTPKEKVKLYEDFCNGEKKKAASKITELQRELKKTKWYQLNKRECIKRQIKNWVRALISLNMYRR